MAQAGFTPISLYFSSTAAAVPTSGNLVNGELALNTADMKLYAKNSAGTVTLLASNAGASGSVTSVSGTGTVNGLTLTGTVTTSGSLTLGGTLSLVSPPAIGSTTPNTGAFTSLGVSGDITQSNINGRITYSNATSSGNGGLQNNNGGSYVLLYPSTHATKPNHTDIQGLTAVNILVGGNIATASSTGLAVTGAISATTTIRTSDGVVGAPTLSFTNETSTGLYRSNNGQMSVAILGSEIGRFTANGLLLNTNSNSVASVIAGGLNSNNGIIQLGSSGTAYQILGGDYQGNMNLFTGAGGGPIIFTPNNTERARITVGFSVGTTSDPGAGAIYATGAITAFFSDKRLKTVSGKIENALDKVSQLSGVYYTFNDTAKSFGYDSDEEHVGVLAQEVEAVLPQIVKAAPFDLDENNNSKSGQNYKTVQYDKLTPLLIEAINELRAEVTALKGTI